MKIYTLSCNLEGNMDDKKFSAIVLDSMPFEGVKDFYPEVFNGALFFREINGSNVRWWHGWLKGFNLVSGIVNGHCVQLLNCGDDLWINVETPKFISNFRAKYDIVFSSVSIDIGGEEVVLI